MLRFRMVAAIALVGLLSAPCGRTQIWDVGSRFAGLVAHDSEGKLKLTFEQRGRFEDRTGNTFGKDVDRSVYLLRTRLGLTWKPVSWLKLSAMGQDSRAPLYGGVAPNTLRDSADLQEAYVELFPDRKGFGAGFGRQMLNYGETRLIGSPQWGNLARTYDQARVYWRSSLGQFEMLLVSPVKIRLDEVNRPVLGERVWGMYDSLPNLFGKNTVEVYLLRHDQNRIAGFTGGNRTAGTDKLGVNTFGGRMTGPAGHGWKYSLEGALQNGEVGPATHRGAAWFTSLARRWKVVERPLDLSAEYKFASGTKNPSDTTRTGTYDQLFPANHDKFGHEDLFGWRNLHNARSLATYGVHKRLAVNLMYSEFWLASLRDSLYNGSGKSIVRSATGTAGRHVGREADLFVTWKAQHFLFGAGYGHFFAGEFVRNTTPGVGPGYAYIFHNYSF